AYRTTPKLVVLPRHVEEVQILLRQSHTQSVPELPRGAGTAQSRGALPLEKGILQKKPRYNLIHQVDPAARQPSLQTVVRNLPNTHAPQPHR
ncbi:FAD-binding protein, partial [Pseudomonas syringae group genomosp. 7]|uniref:FAD-binding protein n=1 Tax=Pseudomonas syringae group genomosp. 7 TaxID=251699 RepID=UPI00376FB7BC